MREKKKQIIALTYFTDSATIEQLTSENDNNYYLAHKVSIHSELTTKDMRHERQREILGWEVDI